MHKANQRDGPGSIERICYVNSHTEDTLFFTEENLHDHCKSNIEYSVPGNIHFGYVSREAGYHDIVTHIGAGAAEVFDPSHQPFTSDYDYDPTGKFRPFLDRNGVGLHMNFGDDPKDHDAVQFGVYLYGKYGRHFTLAQFKRELGTYVGRFERATPDGNQVAPYIASKWPYPVGYFDPTK